MFFYAQIAKEDKVMVLITSRILRKISHSGEEGNQEGNLL